MIKLRNNLQLGLIALVLSAVPAAAAANSPAQNSIHMSLIDNRPFIPVEINQVGQFQFIVDTGGSYESTISSDSADRLHLSGTKTEIATGAGEGHELYRLARVNTLAVGSMKLQNIDMPAGNVKELMQAIGFTQFDGVLGVELFRNNDVTVDVDSGLITFQDPTTFKPPKNAVAVPIEIDKDGMPIVRGRINGLPARLGIDTGDRSSLTIFGPTWRAWHLDRTIGPHVVTMTGYGVGGPIESIVGRITRFSLGGINMPLPVTRLSLQKSGYFTSSDRAGTIGMGVLKRFRVTFDYSHHRMWLSKSAQFDAPDNYDRSGLWLGLAPGNSLTVIAVTSESPADHAGIRNGDLIYRVDSIQANATTIFQIRTLLSQPGNKGARLEIERSGHFYGLNLALRDQIISSKNQPTTQTDPAKT